MARSFTAASSQYLEYGDRLVTAYPGTIAAWFYTTSSNAESFFGMGDIATQNNHWHIQLRGDQSNSLRLESTAGGTTRAVAATLAYSTSTWHHATAVMASSTDRRIYLDGGNKGTQVTSHSFPSSGTDRTRIARRPAVTNPNYVNGYAAEAAVWTAALTDDEVAQLGAGLSPLLVRPESLVAYWPLMGQLSPEIDLVGDYDLTLNASPTTAAHPPAVSYPVPDLSYIKPLSLESNVASTDPGELDRWIMSNFFIDEISPAVQPPETITANELTLTGSAETITAKSGAFVQVLDPLFVKRPIPIGIFDI